MVHIERETSVQPVVRLGLVEVVGTRPASVVPALDQELDAVVADLRTRLAGSAPGEIPHLRAARDLYRAVGIDPTRHRPSPEALLRRILRGDPFPRIHPPVDLGNLWAVLHGLPVGLYDLGCIDGPIVLRLGLPGESYVGIRKDEVHLAGRLTLADARGPFGNPSSDSSRTAVTPDSRDLLYVLFAPSGHDRVEMERWIGWLVERAGTMLGARESTGAVD